MSKKNSEQKRRLFCLVFPFDRAPFDFAQGRQGGRALAWRTLTPTGSDNLAQARRTRRSLGHEAQNTPPFGPPRPIFQTRDDSTTTHPASHHAGPPIGASRRKP